MGKINILVVDDKEHNLLVLREILAEPDYNIVEARSGEEALRHLLKHDFALILLDVHMPVMDGFQTARMMKQRERSSATPIVFLTAGSGDTHHLAEAYSTGAVDFVTKPVDSFIIKSKVAAFAAMHRKELELQEARRQLEESNKQLVALNEALEQRIAERVSELAAKNEAVQTMTQQLWHAAKLATMGELAASIAHELNNPLATISLRVEGLRASLQGYDPRIHTLDVIEQELDRMAELVSNLLQFSRRSRAQVSTIDICEEAAKALDLIEHHLRKNNIRVATDFPQDVQLIQADRQQVRQVFLNLFTNACDAMPDGGSLAVRVRETEQNEVHVEVTDTGVGIPPENLDRVLDPFFTTKPEGKGTGLGLAICSRVATEHGGRLEIESKVDVGTTVRICLPAAGTDVPVSSGTVLE